LLMTVLYPTVIAPIFNKFTPIADPELIFRIEGLAKMEGLEIRGIYQMDATKRSRHTNAYFSGLGKAKRIVLFDSLIQSHDVDEIMAVLAHEIGHLKKNHIKKQLALSSVVSVLLFYLASKMITWDLMFESFGFSIMPAYAGLFLVGIMWEPVSFFLGPAGMALSRRFEREADLYSLRIINDSGPLVRALKKIAKDNLSNLQPHPLYVWLNYSHPPLLERIRDLEARDPIKA
jgi:STE24 endopeptidase